MPERVDVIVVGGGNAAFSAALAAAERSRRVLILEVAPQELAGGNSYYTAGATRIVHHGLDDLRDLVEPDERHPFTTVPPYTAEDYVGDLERVTDGRADPEMARVLADESAAALRALHSRHGLRYRLMYERQAYERPDGTYLFWGGLHVGNVDGGEGMMAEHVRAADRAGVDVRYEHEVTDLIRDGARVTGVRVRAPGGMVDLHADSVILASGGFESDADMRERYLGPGWAKAKVRGTPFNTGALLEKALAIGAARGGDWTTCHSTAWDAWAENNESNRELTNRLTRQSYPLGIVVNMDGQRFIDEGADFRNYTYAKYGAEILKQPGSIAFQLYDATLRPMLRPQEYEMPGVGVVKADSLGELAARVGIPPDALNRTVSQFNAAIDRSVEPDPNIKDGRRAAVDPPKSNWAYPIETPPFYAYAVTCGITFTFGGLRGDLHGRVLREDGSWIEGLYVCGEALGGLFSGNYPGGSGLAAGAVFGRRAGSVA
ncbi:FAD-dependent tricarballylate dehydrogenase TcuA [Georgenia sp. 10Sc9-8]|uniref:FAD-dependent tricarballylate dehydrogenase TcuA n=1 Tax=Georgenia halotolerans TaxID=3028317 RepID=A0ABT5U0M6_9MICO|nr:FAD-dependent tricarballylate dehydrogenase TcuA [Georgenia halotolerans]